MPFSKAATASLLPRWSRDSYGGESDEDDHDEDSDPAEDTSPSSSPPPDLRSFYSPTALKALSTLEAIAKPRPKSAPGLGAFSLSIPKTEAYWKATWEARLTMVRRARTRHNCGTCGTYAPHRPTRTHIHEAPVHVYGALCACLVCVPSVRAECACIIRELYASFALCARTPRPARACFD